MFKSSNQKRMVQLQQLVAYVDAQPDGTNLSWMRVEADTGVTMDEAGKRLFADACQKSKRPYESVRGQGVVFSDANNALVIMSSKLIRVDNARRRAASTHKTLQKRHMDQLSGDDQRKMLTLASFFGAIAGAAKGMRELVRGPKPPPAAPSGASTP